jgi:hypothetical protein
MLQQNTNTEPFPLDIATFGMEIALAEGFTKINPSL